MKHQLKLSISKNPSLDNMIQCRKFSIREKILNILFGKKKDILVLIPSERIKEIFISEKGEDNESNKTIKKCN